MFRTVPLSINGICHRVLLTACEQGQDGTQFRPDPARTAVCTVKNS